jgi:predicted short-subunit dehydrogenase-like oxidoreductase (DUF2520 family)
MLISIIGSGNTATVLGKALKKNDHIINEIAGRNEVAVKYLAEQLDANICTDLAQLNKHSDMYIIAVRDSAVAAVSDQLNFGKKILVHTCGSVSMDVLANSSENYGILYPLQSLRKELNYQPIIPFLVDGNNDFTKQQVFDLAFSVSRSVIIADDETRLQYHLSAIIVSNFINHLFALANEYCDATKTDFSLLLPLIDETVNRLQFYEPASLQTGPAARGDEATIQKHLQLLKPFPQLKKVYEIMSDSISSRK